MFLPARETRISQGSGGGFTGEDLRISLRLRYAGFDTFDLGSTETRGSPLVLGTRYSLGADGTLEVRDGGGCGGFPLTGLGRHDWCEVKEKEKVW